MPRRPWQEELAIIDGVMKAISDISDPEKLVQVYWNGIGELISVEDYVGVSRRGEKPPYYLVTRSSRFTEHFNPWTQRERLPRLTGGLLGEIAYGNKPVNIDDLPSLLKPDDPAHFYLQGFQSLIALPHYEAGQNLNTTIFLYPKGVEIEHDMIPMMNWQAALFGRGTQNLVLRNQLSDALGDLDRELQTVGDIQRSLLPRKLPTITGFDFATCYHTSARAGGDYYDFFPLHDGGYGLFIADVSGHGTPAAVLMAITHAIAHAQPGTHTPPANLLASLNHQLARSYMRGGAFATAFYAVLDPAARTLTYSLAGHNPPRLVRAGRVLSLGENGALPLGIREHETYAEAMVKLEKGDLLLLYTDGVTETMAPGPAHAEVDLFGLERLDKLLMNCGDAGAEECIRRIQSEVAAFAGGAPPTDDQTVIAIRC